MIKKYLTRKHQLALSFICFINGTGVICLNIIYQPINIIVSGIGTGMILVSFYLGYDSSKKIKNDIKNVLN